MAFDAGAIEAVAQIDRTPFQADIDAMKQSVRDFENRGISVTAHVDSDDAWARLDALNHEADRLDGRDVTLNINVKGADDAAAQIALLNTEADSAEKSVGRLNKTASEGGSAFHPLMDAIVLLGPALIPIAGAAIPLLGGLVGVLGSVALGVKGIADEMKAGTTEGQQYTLGIGVLKDDLGQLEQIAAHNLLGPFNDALADAARLMPQLTDETARFSQIGGNVLVSVLDAAVSAFIQLDPLLTLGATYLLQGAQALDQWAQKSGGIQKFTDWALANFPHIMTEIGEIVTLVLHLGEAFGQQGLVALSAVSLLARAIDALPLPVLTDLVEVVTAGYVAWRAYTGINFVVDLYGNISKGITDTIAKLGAESEAHAALTVAIAANDAAMTEFTVAQAAVSDSSFATQERLAALAVQAEATAVAESEAAAAAEGTGIAIGAALGPIGAVAAGVTLLVTQFHLFGIGAQAGAQDTNTLTQALIQSKGAIDDNVRATEAKILSDNGALEIARKLGLSLPDVTSAALGNTDAMTRLNAQMSDQGPITSNTDARQKLIGILEKESGSTSDAVTKAKDLATAEQLSGTAADGSASSYDALTQATKGMSGAQAEANTTAGQAAAQATKTTLAMVAENDAAGLLKAAFDLLNTGHLDLAEAETAMEDQTIQTTATLLKNRDEVGKGTQASVDDEKAIQAQVRALQTQAGSVADNTNSTDAGTAAYQANAASLLAATAASEGLVSHNPNLTQAQNDSATAANEAKDATYQYYVKLLDVADFKPVATQLDVDTSQATGKLAALNAALQIFAIPRTETVRIAVVGSVPQNVPQANGGLLNFFADGAENHVAQVAPAGATRVWAEPETGGEAYIPLAPSKRARSEQILGKVADNFGMKVSHYANGGGTSPASSSSAPSPTISGPAADDIGAAVARHVGPVLAQQSVTDHHYAQQRARQGGK